MEDVKLLDDLGEALDRYEWRRADEIGQSLVGAIHAGTIAIAPKEARRMLGRLRSKRRFHLMQRVADAVIRAETARPFAQGARARLTVSRSRLERSLRAAGEPSARFGQCIGIRERAPCSLGGREVRRAQRLSRRFDQRREEGLVGGITLQSCFARLHLRRAVEARDATPIAPHRRQAGADLEHALRARRYRQDDGDHAARQRSSAAR